MNHTPRSLKRELGTFGAVMMGMGAIVGTGVFVSIGIAAGIAGPAVILAIALAAMLATCNGLSSAQLATNHAVSGGTYEYGYRYARPILGFLAGWMFLWAKSASAATAALGLAGYALAAMGRDGTSHLSLALVAIGVIGFIVLTGMRRTSAVNISIVSLTLAALVFFILAGLPHAVANGVQAFRPFFAAPATAADAVLSPAAGAAAVLHAAALMFVAYTGYGRIATLGEEVVQPRRTIPRAIIITLAATMVLYVAVATVGIGAAGAERFAQATTSRAAPLEVIARSFDLPGARWVLAIGAVTAMAGVLLNLILGLSRVLLAMGRRGDMPRATAKLTHAGQPAVAIIIVTLGIAAIAIVGDVRIAWSFSAFTVLIYYAITNICALRLPPEQRLYPRWVAWCGLAGCLGLAFFVTPAIWLVGLALLALGAVWHLIARTRK